MKKGCAYCEAMHLNQCPDAFSKVSQYCGKFDHEEMPQRAYIYAVDFDGTLCVHKYPEIGAPNEYLIEYLKKERARGCKLILWTCRVGKRLQEAVDWCKAQGLEFDTVNENLPEVLAQWGGVDNRKVFANVYIDDRAGSKSKFHIPYVEAEL